MLAKSLLAALIGVCLFGESAANANDEEFSDVEPFWILLHEPAAVRELKLSADQQRQYQAWLDELDLRFFRLRNKSKEAAQAGLVQLVGEAKQKLRQLLKPAQSERLTQMLYWRIGLSAIVQEEPAKRIGYSKSQRMRMEDILYETQQATAEIEKKVQAGEPRAPLEKKYKQLQTSGQKKVLQILKPEQQTAWKNLLGPQFDVAQLGQPQYKVPELIATDGWLNSNPLTLADQRGKVVVVHFYACGCINCIHNYPTYLEWQKKFESKDVLLIGIHSPETDAERDLSHVRQKAAEAKLTFPILLDAQSENWNAWGNSMWPSVYVIDKRGYLRNFWPGELKWKGSKGDTFLSDRIESLLKE